MKAIVLLACLLVCVVVGTTTFDAQDVQEYREYMAMHGKVYAEEEFSMRLQLYLSTKDFVEKHNADPTKTFKVGLNKFADLKEEEKPKRTHVESACWNPDVEAANKKPISSSIPDNLDYRTGNYVPPVMNEGQCGSVSYVVVAQQVSTQTAITSNKTPPTPLSAQQLIDCGPGDGCDGGNPWPLYNYVKKYGLMSQASYPYGNGTGGPCKYNKADVVASIRGYKNITGEPEMLDAIATNGPLSAIIDASSSEFEMYTSGVFTAVSDCNANNPDHVLLIVGYGTTTTNPPQDYYIAQNVWGTDWGMNGYILIARGGNVCGIESCCSFVYNNH